MADSSSEVLTLKNLRKIQNFAPFSQQGLVEMETTPSLDGDKEQPTQDWFTFSCPFQFLMV